MREDPGFLIEFGPLYREEKGALRFWRLAGYVERDGLEVERLEGVLGEKPPQRTELSLMSREDFLLFGEREEAQKRAEGFSGREPKERLVVRLQVLGEDKEKAILTRDFIEGLLWGALVESGESCTVARDISDSFAYLFLTVLAPETAVQTMQSAFAGQRWQPFEDYRIGHLEGEVYFDVTSKESAQRRWRLPFLTSRGLRRFSLSSVANAFETGKTSDGKQILLGLRPPYLKAFLFDEDGIVTEEKKEEWQSPPPREELIYQLEDKQFQERLSAQLASWKEALGFTPGPILVQRFFSVFEGAGIDEFPLSFLVEEEEEEEAANIWLTQGNFLFWWGRAYGSIGGQLSIWKENAPGAAQFTGASLPMEKKPGAPEKIQIPFDDDDNSRFNTLGTWGEGRRFMAFVTGADPIDPRFGRPMYPHPDDPNWPKKKRWYGALHLFDQDGAHQQTLTILGGTTADGKGDSGQRAFRMTNAALRGLAPLEFGPIEVRPFAVVCDGYLFGLVYEPKDDKGGDYAMLWPNDVMFHPPWDGGYST